MKTLLNSIGCCLLATGLFSCATPPQHACPQEHGPHGTIAYYIEITASHPGARIEVCNQTAGHAPMKLKIWGDKDGTFHFFGSEPVNFSCNDVMVITGYGANGQSQEKRFRTVVAFGQEDNIPAALYFDVGP